MKLILFTYETRILNIAGTDSVRNHTFKLFNRSFHRILSKLSIITTRRQGQEDEEGNSHLIRLHMSGEFFSYFLGNILKNSPWHCTKTNESEHTGHTHTQ